MKTWIQVAGVTFIVIVFLFSSSAGCREGAAAASKYVINYVPPESSWQQESKDQVNKVIDKIEKEIEAINALDTSQGLTNEAIRKIVALHGRNGTYKTHARTTCRGDGEIGVYLTLNRDLISNYRIELKVVYAEEYTSVLYAKEKKDGDVVHGFVFIFSNKYKFEGKDVDPDSSTSCPHVRLCECDRGR